MINQSPGLEDVYSVPKDAITPDDINEIRKANIVNDMKDNLSPRETAKRRHRKNLYKYYALSPVFELEQIFRNILLISCVLFLLTSYVIIILFLDYL